MNSGIQKQNQKKVATQKIATIGTRKRSYLSDYSVVVGNTLKISPIFNFLVLIPVLVVDLFPFLDSVFSICQFTEVGKFWTDIGIHELE